MQSGMPADPKRRNGNYDCRQTASEDSYERKKNDSNSAFFEFESASDDFPPLEKKFFFHEVEIALFY